MIMQKNILDKEEVFRPIPKQNTDGSLKHFMERMIAFMKALPVRHWLEVMDEFWDDYQRMKRCSRRQKE